MSIYKTPNGYRVQVDLGKLPDGRRDRKTRTCKTQREAKKAEAELMAQAHGLQGRSNRVTLTAFIDQHYLPEKEAVLRKNTIKGYKRDINLRIKPYLGSMLIGDIKHGHIQTMLRNCKTRKVATNARDTLRSILSYAVDMDIIAKNPALGSYKFPQAISTKEGDDAKAKREQLVTSFAEHQRIIKAAKDPLTQCLLVLGFCFGLRKGEILGLEWQDVDFDARTITIRRTVTWTREKMDVDPPKTERSKRIIPMSEFAYSMLWSFANDGKVTHIKGPVAKRNGTYVTPHYFNKLVERFCRQEGIPHFTPSTMRHSFATAAILAGIDVAVVSKWLGHAQITTTYNRYVKPLLSDLHADVEKIDKAYKTA